ncbi:hypothetical protein CCY99_08510 [Helicobacter sp. 16-1353]|uniref:hypothetical protein n=1 Tax=Helicobacter sp. 16-1353 TaxID=2004996 RepID=UPI000DCCA77F|nr:hypothetical protein [Helicobacter sp. 16-1353]RAX51705.1 hypothetical protein CCY99_08510 [Helicobacter sp. 16-1353]
MIKKIFISLLVMGFSSSLFAHSALMNCFDNGDETVTCEGGFSDGSSANGVKFAIVQNGKSIISGKFGEDSSYTFKKPNGTYEAHLDAGEGHKVVVKSKDIAE